MKNTEINPGDIIHPQSNTERFLSFFTRGTVTKDVIRRLKELNTTVTLSDGKEVEVTIDQIEAYIKKEVEYETTYHPSGYQYNFIIEKNRRRTQKMEGMLKKKNYPGLIMLMLDQAIEHWNIAKKADIRVQQMSPEERALIEKMHADSIGKEREISKLEKETGMRQEHGFPPFLLEVGGASDRDRSKIFLAYAVVLARANIQTK